MSIKNYFSPLGNQQFHLLPFTYPQQPWCKIMNKFYRMRIMRSIANYSNFPFTEDRERDICDIFPQVILLKRAVYKWNPIYGDLYPLLLRPVISNTFTIVRNAWSGSYYLRNYYGDFSKFSYAIRPGVYKNEITLYEKNRSRILNCHVTILRFF